MITFTKPEATAAMDRNFADKPELFYNYRILIYNYRVLIYNYRVLTFSYRIELLEKCWTK